MKKQIKTLDKLNLIQGFLLSILTGLIIAVFIVYGGIIFI